MLFPFCQHIKKQDAEIGVPPQNILSLAETVNTKANTVEISPEDVLLFLNSPSHNPDEFENLLKFILVKATADKEFHTVLHADLGHELPTLSPIDPLESTISERRIRLTSSLLSQISKKGFSFTDDTNLAEFIVNAIGTNATGISPNEKDCKFPVCKRHLESILGGLSALPDSTFAESVSKLMKRGSIVTSSIMSWVMTIPATLTEDYRLVFDQALEEFVRCNHRLFDYQLAALLDEPVYASVAQSTLIKESQKVMGDVSSWQDPILIRLDIFYDRPWAQGWALEYATDYFTFLVDSYTNSFNNSSERDQYSKMIRGEARYLRNFIEHLHYQGSLDSQEAGCSARIEAETIKVLDTHLDDSSRIILNSLYDIEAAFCDTWDQLNWRVVFSIDDLVGENDHDIDHTEFMYTLNERLAEHVMREEWNSYFSLAVSSLEMLSRIGTRSNNQKWDIVSDYVDNLLYSIQSTILHNPGGAQVLKQCGLVESISDINFPKLSSRGEQELTSIRTLLESAPNHTSVFSFTEADKFYTAVVYEIISRVFDRDPKSPSLSLKDVKSLDYIPFEFGENCTPKRVECLSEALVKLATCRSGISPQSTKRINAIAHGVGSLLKSYDETLHNKQFLPLMFEAFMELGVPFGPEI